MTYTSLDILKAAKQINFSKNDNVCLGFKI